MILVSEESFKNYLRKNGYREWSKNGNETTIHSYVYWVKRVMDIEKIPTWSELTENIHSLIRKYGKYGSMCKFGQEGHSTCINALKQFEEFLINDYEYTPPTGIYFI